MVLEGMITNVLKNGFKNKQTMRIAIVAPIVILIILGDMVTMIGTVEPVKIGVINNDKGIGSISAATSIIDEIKKQENVTMVSISPDEIKSDLDSKTINAALVFPENFTIWPQGMQRLRWYLKVLISPQIYL